MDDNATTAPMANKTRTSRGRQRIEIKKIEVETKRQVTFSKRRKGLFKKAEELSTLCGAEVGILTISKSGKVFGTVNIDAVVERYRPDSSSDHHGSVKKKKEVEVQQSNDNASFWLDQSIEKLPTEKLTEYVAVLKDLREKATFRLDEISIQDYSSLWSFITDQQVIKDEFVNQFNFMGEKENLMGVLGSSIK